MSYITSDGKRQCAVTMVTFRDMSGAMHVIMGQLEPRHRDYYGTCLQGTKLAVGPYQFAGGFAEDDDLESFKELDTAHPNLFGALQHPDPTERLVAYNAVREASEELSLSMEWIKRGQIRHLKQTEGKAHNNKYPVNVHYFQLDLGTLSRKEVTALKEEIAPRDDIIKTLIIRADKIRTNDDDQLIVYPRDGTRRTKRDYEIPEKAKWYRNIDRQENADVTRQISHIETIEGMSQLKGLGGIDTRSLRDSNPVPILACNADVLRPLLEAERIAPPHCSIPIGDWRTAIATQPRGAVAAK